MKIFSLLDTQYNRFSAAIRNYLSKTLIKNGESYGNSTIFGQFINVLNAAIQNIMLYIEDAFTEQNKYTAQRKKSIYGLASLSGYQPSTGKATGVQLKLNFTPSNTPGLNIILNNKESLTCTQNGLQYNIILPQEVVVLSMAVDNSTKYIYAVQGKFETQSFISSGGKFYTQNFKYIGNIDIDYLEVYINDEKWERTYSVYDMTPNGKQFTYSVNYTGGLDIIFGNDVHGQSLKNGDIIRISYLTHDGELGNMDINKNTYFVFDNMLKDISGESVNGNDIFNITFATSDPISSGSNSESKDQVKNMIGYNSRSIVMTTPENYKNFINKFSFCGYNRTWSDRGSMSIQSLIIKNYALNLSDGKDYFNLTQKDFILSNQQKKSIQNAVEINGNQLAGITYNIVDPEIYKYALYLYIKPKSQDYDKIYITQQIRELVGDFFANINSDLYIPKSDITNLIKNNISAIDGVNIYFLSEKNETAIINKQYINKTEQYNPAKGTYDSKTETIYLYDGENPNLGLDDHGNIYLENNNSFPVLMGGWKYKNNQNQIVDIIDPLIITFQ